MRVYSPLGIMALLKHMIAENITKVFIFTNKKSILSDVWICEVARQVFLWWCLLTVIGFCIENIRCKRNIYIDSRGLFILNAQIALIFHLSVGLGKFDAMWNFCVKLWFPNLNQSISTHCFDKKNFLNDLTFYLFLNTWSKKSWIYF